MSNIITNEGKRHIKRYLAGYVPFIARSVAFGIGNASESVNDTALQLEVASSVIDLIYYDFLTEQLVFKASLPSEYSGKVYEIGLYSLSIAPSGIEYASRTLTTFDSATEQWVDPSNQTPATFGTTSTRVGVDSLLFTPAASGSTTYAIQSMQLDLSGYSASDSFTFAFNVGNANTSAVRVRMMTDTNNYYDFNLGAQTAGYKILTATKGSATATGNPSWDTINQIQVTVTSSGSGASSVEFEAIRAEDKDSINLDYVLVARKVLSTPETKDAGVPHDVEFRLDVTL